MRVYPSCATGNAIIRILVMKMVIFVGHALIQDMRKHPDFDIKILVKAFYKQKLDLSFKNTFFFRHLLSKIFGVRFLQK